jgi:hypothetical protein
MQALWEALHGGKVKVDHVGASGHEAEREFAAISSDIQQAFHLNALLEWILRAAITHPTSKDQESMVLRVKVSM